MDILTKKFVTLSLYIIDLVKTISTAVSNVKLRHGCPFAKFANQVNWSYIRGPL
jgi:hypothetical protein